MDSCMIYLWSLILDSWPCTYDACVSDVYICDPDVCKVYMICDPGVCTYDAYIYDPGPWCKYLRCRNAECIYPWYINVSMIQLKFCHWLTNNQMIFDPDVCMYDACIYYLRPLTLVHVRFMRICMMHVHLWSWSLILMHACKYDDVSMMWLKFCHGRTNERTNEQGDSRSRIYYILYIVIFPLMACSLFLTYLALFVFFDNDFQMVAVVLDFRRLFWLLRIILLPGSKG